MGVALAAPQDLARRAPLRQARWPDSAIDELKARGADGRTIGFVKTERVVYFRMPAKERAA